LIKSNIVFQNILLIIFIITSSYQYVYAQGTQPAQLEYFYNKMKNNNIKKVECYAYYSPTDSDMLLASVLRLKNDNNILEYVSYWSRDSSILYFNSNGLITKKIIYSGNGKATYELKYNINNKLLSEIGKEKGEIATTTKYYYNTEDNLQSSITYDHNNIPFIVDTTWYDKEGRIITEIGYGRQNKFESSANYFYNNKNQLIKIKSSSDNIDFQYDSKNLRISETWSPKDYYKFVYRYFFY